MTIDLMKPGTLVKLFQWPNEKRETQVRLRNYFFELEEHKDKCYYTADFDSWFLVLDEESFGFISVLSPEGIKVLLRFSFLDWENAIIADERVEGK